MDQPLEAGTISIFHTMQKNQQVTQTLATHTSLLQATAKAAVILNHYWLAVIDSALLKLKSIIFLEFHVLFVQVIYVIFIKAVSSLFRLRYI